MDQASVANNVLVTTNSSTQGRAELLGQSAKRFELSIDRPDADLSREFDRGSVDLARNVRRGRRKRPDADEYREVRARPDADGDLAT